MGILLPSLKMEKFAFPSLIHSCKHQLQFKQKHHKQSQQLLRLLVLSRILIDLKQLQQQTIPQLAFKQLVILQTARNQVQTNQTSNFQTPPQLRPLKNLPPLAASKAHTNSMDCVRFTLPSAQSSKQFKEYAHLVPKHTL